MFKLIHCLVAGAMVSVAVTAHAEPNMPRRAKTLRVELVRAYADCKEMDNGIRDTDWAACTTDKPLSAFDFGTRGHASARASMASTGDSFKLRLDLEDVRDSTGKPVDDSVSFTLRFLYRITTNHCDQPHVCTTTAFDNRDTVAQCKHGSCHGHARVSLGVMGDQAFPSSVEIKAMTVLDPTNNVFATQGTISGAPQ